MTLLRTSLIWLILSIPACLHAQQKMDGLVWAKDVLTWEHFQEKGGTQKGIAGVYMKMLVDVPDSIIETGGLKRAEIKIYALIIPGLSYVKNGYATKGTLAHESMHFNILETFARRFRKELVKMEFSEKRYKKEIEALRREIWREAEKTQKQYDKTHRQKEGGHDWWAVEIDRQLQELCDYADPAVWVVIK